MRINGKKWLSTALVLASVLLVVWIAFGSNDLGKTWQALKSLDPLWTAGIFCCWFFYMFFDAFGYWIYFRSEGFPIRLGRCITSSLICFYYSNITPTSAGGQPMLINSLRKAGIPVGYGTMASTIRFICNQFVVAAGSLFFWLLNREFVAQQLGSVIWIIRLGWIINFAGIPLVLMAAFRRSLIQRICSGIISLCVRMKLIRNRDVAMSSVTNVLDTYHTALRELLHRPGRILAQIFCAAAGIMSLIGSIYFVYHAFGLNGTRWDQLITVSFLLYVSACYTPLPGASGAQEGGFLLFFSRIIPDELLGLALLVWRFFTYYLFLIVGVAIVILERWIISRERKKENGQPSSGDARGTDS